MKRSGSQPEESRELTQKALHALTRARVSLVMEHPFFAVLAMRLTFKEDSACRDFWTNGRTLGFNPVYAATLPAKKLVGALAHEVLHLAFGHHVRRKARDEKLWNRACDYAINLVLLDSGFVLPEGFAHDPQFIGMAVDDIYSRLASLQSERNSLGAKGSQDMPGSVAGPSGSTGNGDGEESESQKAASVAASDQMQSLPTQNVKQRLTGRSDKQQKSADKKSGQTTGDFTGEVRDHPFLDDDMSDKALQAAEQEAEIVLSQAMQRAMHMGDLPAGLTRLLKRSFAPQLGWRELLRRFLENCADADYSWTTPNRRYVYQGVYLPSRRESRIPHLAVAVDSSGSVDEQALALFCSELSTILENWDTTLTVLFHDTRVQNSLSFTRSDLPLTLLPVGGGGTDYRPVCEYIEDQQLHPSCLIWFTDMQCNRFPEEPPYPVLWVSTLPLQEAVPFGEAISLQAVAG